MHFACVTIMPSLSLILYLLMIAGLFREYGNVSEAKRLFLKCFSGYKNAPIEYVGKGDVSNWVSIRSNHSDSSHLHAVYAKALPSCEAHPHCSIPSPAVHSRQRDRLHALFCALWLDDGAWCADFCNYSMHIWEFLSKINHYSWYIQARLHSCISP